MKTNKGFTLIELMIVVAIIGILSAIAIPKFADLIRQSNEGATKGNLGAVRSALSIYYGEQEGKYPVNSTGYSGGGAVVDLGTTLTMENGKYIKAMPAAYCPPYFGKSIVVVSLSTNSTGGGSGNWGYQDNATPAVTDKQWGDFWVDCNSTDSKATIWNSY
jgi:prepilin-type N-terminal cleavage/methylation domain-containing protein